MRCNMKNGGYIIIDLKDVSLSATPVDIAGIYNKIFKIEEDSK